jgi:predicted O-linked N-acetylglucosamine transferase (SPINDLY family)
MSADSVLRRAYEHIDARRWEKAAGVCDAVLRRHPNHAEALGLRGAVASQQGDDAAAVKWLDRAIELLPQRWDLHHNAGVAHRRLGQLDEAVLRLRTAVALKPDSAEASHSLAAALADQGLTSEAIAVYERALELADRSGARTALADLLLASGRVDDAAAHYEHALVVDDTVAAAWYGLGGIKLTAKAYRAAAACFNRCAALKPDMFDAWFGLGCAQLARNHHLAAAEAFRQCVRLNPASVEAHHNLGQCLFNLGDVDGAIESFRRCVAQCERRSERDDAMELPLQSIAVVIPGSPSATHKAVLEARAAWGATQRATPLASAAVAVRDRLRIGYVSAFFGHENWMKPVWGLLNQHDRTRFAIHLFSDGAFANAQRVEAAQRSSYRPCDDDVVRDISGLDNDSAAARIAADGIDVLVDLNGYSRMDRLPVFARRPAGLIVAWFNQFATTGVPWFDYLIGDAHVIRPEEEPFYSETVLRVPGSYLTFSVDYPVPDVQPPPCLVRGFVTFGSFCSQYKITPDVLAAWSEILARVPSSRLFLKNAALGVAEHRSFLLDKLAAHGVSHDRVELHGPDSHFEFLRAYGEIDIALDTFPYNGGTTTTEAIWQGVPVVTFDGDRWASRTSASLLREAELGAWVARDPEGYVRLACQWAARDKLAELEALRAGMRNRARGSSACDTRSFARAMEDLYRQIYERKRQAG